MQLKILRCHGGRCIRNRQTLAHCEEYQYPRKMKAWQLKKRKCINVLPLESQIWAEHTKWGVPLTAKCIILPLASHAKSSHDSVVGRTS